VGAYAGLAPRLFESGTMSRQGRISGRGNRLLRALLVEVAWLMRRYNARLRTIFDQVCRGSKTRRKIAVVADHGFPALHAGGQRPAESERGRHQPRGGHRGRGNGHDHSHGNNRGHGNGQGHGQRQENSGRAQRTG